MKIDIVTIFPNMFTSPFAEGIVFRAIQKGLVEIRMINLRDFTTDPHKTTDDLPFGGGGGMVMKPEPIFKAVQSCMDQRCEPQRGSHQPCTPSGSGRSERIQTIESDENKPRIILLSPQGRTLDQSLCNILSKEKHLILICGRYSGVDERVREHLITDEISIGDYILSGGEFCAMILVEAMVRLIPGALGNEESAQEDSFQSGLLDGPRFTRPQNFEGHSIPEILLSGDHEKIKVWRRRESLKRTLRFRPDLIEKAELTEEDRGLLKNIKIRK